MSGWGFDMTIQEFDLPARWRTLLLENYSEAIHTIEVQWPDLKSLEVSYRDIESFDPDFATQLLKSQKTILRLLTKRLDNWLQNLALKENPVC